MLITPDTFRLPDLRGRILLGAGGDGIGNGSRGQERDLINRPLGSFGGDEQHTLTTEEMPAHRHLLVYENATPAGEISANGNEGLTSSTAVSVYHNAGTQYHLSSTGNTQHDANIGLSSVTGGNQPHNNVPPFQAMYHIIHA